MKQRLARAATAITSTFFSVVNEHNAQSYIVASSLATPPFHIDPAARCKISALREPHEPPKPRPRYLVSPGLNCGL